MGFDSVVAIGDSYNDIPMFESSDIRIAYGGVHPPVNELVKNANYITYDGERLCRLLKMLS